MFEIVDLSQEIFHGMPFIRTARSKVSACLARAVGRHYRQRRNYPAVNLLELGDHTGAHVDAQPHGPGASRWSIGTMPLTMFYTEGICLDVC
jgi:kynurenine formamidase